MTSNQDDLSLQLKAVFDTAIDGIITIDSQGIVEMVNTSAADLFNYNPDEIIGKNIKMLMPQPYKDAHDEYIDHYNKTKEARIIGIGREVKGRKKNGDIFPLRLAVSEVILNDRIIFTGIVHDLTDLRNANRKILEINKDFSHYHTLINSTQ